MGTRLDNGPRRADGQRWPRVAPTFCFSSSRRWSAANTPAAAPFVRQFSKPWPILCLFSMVIPLPLDNRSPTRYIRALGPLATGTTGEKEGEEGGEGGGGEREREFKEDFFFVRKRAPLIGTHVKTREKKMEKVFENKWMCTVGRIEIYYFSPIVNKWKAQFRHNFSK